MANTTIVASNGPIPTIPLPFISNLTGLGFSIILKRKIYL